MRAARAWMLGCVAMTGCVESGGDETTREESVGPASEERVEADLDAGAVPCNITYRSDVKAVTRVEDAKPGVFIPPYRSCEPPKSGGPGQGPNGEVCTNVMISGATEEGRYFPDYASCGVVITQRPFWSAPPARTTAPDDPRLKDAAYMEELAWAKTQIEATGCVCCHDSKSLGKQASQWDVRAEPIWLDSLSDTGLALFAGLADSSVLGAYHADENNGFDRTTIGIPTTDIPRMERFMKAELTRRGISEAEARAVPPFGGPIYENRVAKPTACKAGEGITPEGRVRWQGGNARYVYVLDEKSENPGVPPNLDLPEGTQWRLDVLPNADGVASGLTFGTTPAGSFQAFPERTPAAALEQGKTYHLTVLRDVGLPLVNCLFTFGEPVAEPQPIDAGAPMSTPDGGASACTLPGGDEAGFGAACKSSADCTCAASYCALQPGQSTGYCSKTGCSPDARECPSGWSCFDLSRFVPGQPAFCAR